jgi:hypothetical protein
VRLKDVLAQVGASPSAKWVRALGADVPPMPTVPPFARSIPMEKAMHPSTILAYAMNGAPLSLLHGAPLRLVVPGWVGDDWIKWLTSIDVGAEPDAGFFQRVGYRAPKTPVTPGAAVKPEDTESLTTLVVKSIITKPSDGGTIAAGKTAITGIAFAGEDAVAKVEVSVDGGASFRAATLDPPKGLGAWQRWRLLWTPTPGNYRILSRATDARGRTQPDLPAWNPGGYLWNAPDAITVEVRA